jgi:hypothetical protein
MNLPPASVVLAWQYPFHSGDINDGIYTRTLYNEPDLRIFK